MKKEIVFCLLGMLAAAPAYGFTISGNYTGTTNYVSKSGNDANNGKSWATAKKTIQAAVDLCADGDTVIVDDGEYSDTTAWTTTNSGTTYNNPVVVKITKRIHLVSRNGKHKTHIVGQLANTASGVANDGTAHRCIYVSNVANVLIEGFTIRNGATAGTAAGNNNFDSAGGVCGGTGSTGYLVDCDVVNCRAGLGAALSRGIVPIRCVFRGNRSVNTHHVFYRASNAYNCVFEGNGPDGSRSGCIFSIVQAATAINCTFINNTCYGFAPNATYHTYAYNCAFLGTGEQVTSGSTGTSGGYWDYVHTTNTVQTATGGRVAVEGSGANCKVGVSSVQFYYAVDSGVLRHVANNDLHDAGLDDARTIAARFVPEEYLDTDILGNPRKAGAHVDIGAFEIESAPGTPATGTLTLDNNISVRTNGVDCGVSPYLPIAFDAFPGQIRLVPNLADGTPFFGFAITGGWTLYRFPDLGADGGAWLTPPPVGTEISISAKAAAGEMWVQSDYAGGDSDGSPEKPYTTITEASEASQNYGLVHVRKGVYNTGSTFLSGHAWPARVAIDKSVAVRSVDGADETFIVGDASTRCVAVRSITYDVHFQGFTITGGTADGTDDNALCGGGFWVTPQSWADATGLALGAHCSQVTDCVFSNNVARHAAAMTGGWAQRCVFTDNRIGETFAKRGAVASCSILSACLVTNNLQTHTSSISSLRNCAPHNVTFAESNKVAGTSTDYCPVDQFTPAFNCAFLGGHLNAADSSVLAPAGNVGDSDEGSHAGKSWLKTYDKDVLFVDPAAGNLHLQSHTGSAFDGDGTARNAALFAVGDFEGNALMYVNGNPIPGAYSDIDLSTRELFVDAVNGDDAHDGLTAATAKRTLAAILPLATYGDTVHAAQGDYNDGSETYGQVLYYAHTNGNSPSRGIVRRGVALVAEEGPDVTFITGVIGTGNNNNLGDNAIRCLTMLPGSTVRGFTLRDGATFHTTGGVYDNNVGGNILAPSCANGRSGTALIENCVLTNGCGRTAGCVIGGILRRCKVLRGRCTSGASLSMYSRFEHCLLVGNADTAVRNCGGMYSTTFYNSGNSNHQANGELMSTMTGARFENSILITQNVKASDNSHITLKNVRNCIWCVGGDRAQIDVATSANVVTGTLATAKLDTSHGYRPLVGSPAINAGDQTLLANMTDDVSTDLVGTQRVYDGEVDIGAYEYDIRPAMSALLYKKASVTAAAPVARIVGETIVLSSGEVAATIAQSGLSRFLVPVQVTGTGTFSIYVGDSTTAVATATSSDGAKELRLALPAGETVRFAYEPGANDTGSAILGSLVSASGMTVIFR